MQIGGSGSGGSGGRAERLGHTFGFKYLSVLIAARRLLDGGQEVGYPGGPPADLLAF